MPKKLIEVALPLEAINVASAREKSIRHGHPSTLHLWWARRPLAAARAVIFAQMVDDPAAVEKERQRLFGLIEEPVTWENTTNEKVLEKARDLAYRLYNSCERQAWAEEARNYNALVIAWPDLVQLSQSEENQTSRRYVNQEILCDE